MSSPSPHFFAIGLLASGIGVFLTPTSAVAIEPKRVLVVTVTMGFRHSSISAAERTLQKFAHESKDFMIVDILRQPDIQVPQKPAPPNPLPANATQIEKDQFTQEELHYKKLISNWTPDIELQTKKAQEELNRQLALTLSKLSPAALEEAKIDGVIFANTSGELPLPDRDGFIQWIEKGHAFIGVHSAADTLRNFPAYSRMIGCEYAGHGSQTSLELTAKDTAHPAVKDIKNPWRIQQEEFSRFKDFDRTRVHDLWASSKKPNDKRPDQGERGHFPVSWVRMHGTGKVFYTSLGHREDLWDDNKDLPSRVNWPQAANSPETSQGFQKHLLGGIRWALGLEPGDAVPQISE
ncbi:MAG: ThuA domain-containing protein [Verrucomicrobiota bacterium]